MTWRKRAISDYFSEVGIEEKVKTSGLSRSEDKTGRENVGVCDVFTSSTVLSNYSRNMEWRDVQRADDASKNKMDSHVWENVTSSSVSYWDRHSSHRGTNSSPGWSKVSEPTRLFVSPCRIFGTFAIRVRKI